MKGKREVNVGTDKTVDIDKIMTRFIMDDDNFSIRNWVNYVEEDEESITNGYCKLKFKKRLRDGENSINLPNFPEFPEELDYLLDYCTMKKNVPRNEQRAYVLHVIKPCTDLKKKKKISIEKSELIVSDRFIYCGGSNEFIRMEVLDLSGVDALSGLIPKQKMMDAINVPVTKNEVIHLETESSVSMSICVNNDTNYTRPPKDGHRSGIKTKKYPDKRYMIVLDIIATSEKVKTVLKEKTSFINSIVNDKPNSEQAKLINKVTEKMKKDDDDGPLLVDVHPDDQKETEYIGLKEKEIDDSDSDVEDVGEY